MISQAVSWCMRRLFVVGTAGLLARLRRTRDPGWGRINKINLRLRLVLFYAFALRQAWGKAGARLDYSPACGGLVIRDGGESTKSTSGCAWFCFMPLPSGQPGARLDYSPVSRTRDPGWGRINKINLRLRLVLFYAFALRPAWGNAIKQKTRPEIRSG